MERKVCGPFDIRALRADTRAPGRVCGMCAPLRLHGQSGPFVPGTDDAFPDGMSSIHDVFGRTVQKSAAWIEEIAADLDLDAHQAYRALRAVLHALRDRLSPVEAAELAAQMPMLIRGLYYEGWTPTGKPHRVKRPEEFLEHVRAELSGGFDDERAAEAVAAVFRLLNRHISAGELDDVRHCLPHALRALWPLT